MNRFINSGFVPLIFILFLYFWGPDFLSLILFGMPVEEGAKLYAGNGWAYIGRDLDFIIEGCNWFSIESIWRLMPLKIVLPQIQSLLLIGVLQVLCFFLLIYYFFKDHQILKVARRCQEFSYGRSFIWGGGFVVGFGVILLSIEMVYYYFYQKDFIFENFVSNNINNQKLILHPLYFTANFLVGCLGASIFEETFFRRLLFPLLRNKFPFVLSAILNAILFALMHDYSLLIFSQTFICGFIGCIIFEETKSILGCIVFHFMGNFCILVLPLLYPLDLFQ